MTPPLDMRPALVAEDVEDLELSNFRAGGTGPVARLCLREARQVYLHNCRPLNDVAVFLSVEGSGSQGILLQANDLRRAGQDCRLAEGVSEKTIIKA